MQELIGIFALLVAAVGWYYLFYSRATQKLESIEEARTNRQRGMLRRINAIVMLLMAVGIATATFRFIPEKFPQEWAVTWVIVIALLLLCVTLGLIDLRLTMKLRQQLRERRK